jgi:hypothetical protein
MFYANLRQAFLNSPAYADRISSKTVLFMSVPDDYKNEEKLRQVFGETIRKIWITSDCKELDKKVQQRDKYAHRLERLETKLIRRANSMQLKQIKAGTLPCTDCFECETCGPPMYDTIKRPTHRLKLFGKKVDSIHWLREELVSLTKEIEVLQRKHRNLDSKLLSAIFIEFNSQSDAQIALQTLSHHQPLHMTPRFTGISPDDVVWSALNLSWWQRIVRRFIVQGAIAALIIFWSLPSAVVGAISNISYLTSAIPPLKFIDKLPDVIKGVIAGLLPAGALVLLMSLVPIICRCMFDPLPCRYATIISLTIT